MLKIVRICLVQKWIKIGKKSNFGVRKIVNFRIWPGFGQDLAREWKSLRILITLLPGLLWKKGRKFENFTILGHIQDFGQKGCPYFQLSTYFIYARKNSKY